MLPSHADDTDRCRYFPLRGCAPESSQDSIIQKQDGIILAKAAGFSASYQHLMRAGENRHASSGQGTLQLASRSKGPQPQFQGAAGNIIEL